MSALIGISGEFKDQTLLLEGDVISVGRADTNALRLTDSLVSGRHCAFIREAGQWIIKDYDSTNGTQLNGIRVDESPLTDQDVVTIGNCQFQFQAEVSSMGSSIFDSKAFDFDDEPMERTQAIELDLDAMNASIQAKKWTPPPPPVPPPVPVAAGAAFAGVAIAEAAGADESELEEFELEESELEEIEPSQDLYEEYESAIFRASPIDSDLEEHDDDDDEQEDDEEAEKRSKKKRKSRKREVEDEIDYDSYQNTDDDEEESDLREWLERPAIVNTIMAFATSGLLCLLAFVYLSLIT